MFKFKRVTGYYILENHRNYISIHHQPKWLFYFANKQKFFKKRREAYEKIATLLKDPTFWPKQSIIKTRSLTIDFTRETPNTEKINLRLDDKPGIIFLWFFNFYNWRISRWIPLLRILKQKEISSITLSRKSFIEIYERR